MLFNNRSTLMLMLSVLLLLVACSNSTTNGTANTSEEKNLFIGMVNPPIAFNTINSSDVASQYIEGFMFDSLLDMPESLKFTPKLAESFETTDNQTYTIKINAKANWSDGTPVTAEDAAFTLNLIANPNVETHVGNFLTPLEGLENGKLPEGVAEIPSVKVIDEKTLEFKTTNPVDPNMIKEQLGVKLMILPKHILQDVDPKELSKDPFMQNPTVTNGPFKFVQYKKDQYVEFEKNPDYYLGTPKIDKIYVKIMPASNLVAQLQTGEIQMNNSLGKIAVQDYETVKKIENVKTELQQTIGFQMLVFNMETIKDAKLRQAMAYAINRESIVDDLLKGTGEIIDGPYTSLNPYLNNDLTKYTYDPEKAKQLLAESGWDINQTLDFVVPLGNKVREQSANIIVQNLEDIGIKVKTATYDFPSSLQMAKEGDYDLYLLGNALTVDPDVSSMYASNGSFNFMNYNNPKVDQLLADGKAEPIAEKRKVIYEELQEIWEADLPVLTLYSDYNFAAVSDSVSYGKVNILDASVDYHLWDLE
ncbi:ABC transporter substrate-binding protein [Niallia sp. JL1B1071]|uniref:ABC transporter substrate-binding protein n=1 Tax=Niallia tiangongensis TaxID=3237105 RepID=UPI0037DC0100